MNRLRTEKQGTAMWKIFGHMKVHECPECQKSQSLTYLGFAKNYMAGLHAKIYQCQDCNSWVDVIWEKYRKRNKSEKPANV